MKISTESLTILSTALTFPDAISAQITAKLDRAAYLDVNKVLEALGGKWNRKAKVHLFEPGEESAQDRVERVLLVGEVTSKKSDLAFFPTPEPIANQLVRTVGVRDAVVLEPSAGKGALISAALVHGAKKVVAIERDPQMRRALIAMESTLHGLTVLSTEQDFLDYTPPKKFLFDNVVMNPPFKKGCARSSARHWIESTPCTSGRASTAAPRSCASRSARSRRGTSKRSDHA